ncbi:CDP-glycerol glycerophosphotransferase [Sphaerotilus hippei]|uniref:CDP-glycerol glycerophosphotransferase n=1 Tax=Sphaerotilus hippei TaxID=744406 RepID=A0A318H2D8_9BURK|nr:CDP-glycerol glycerophosphotransferase family protein [Sphaerotilus hippei]PXW91925.1 CDP-glycerol glycerophosphotransferase [Sphaerotilus hippei]
MLVHAASPAVPGPVAGTDVAARLEQLEASNAQMVEAIDQLVSALLDTRAELAEARKPAPPDTSRPLLEARLQELEKTVALERCLQDLTAVSRAHLKRRLAVFVGTTYLGCNVKYAWLAARDAAAAQDMDIWFLPHDARQEAQILSLTPDCFPHNWDAWSAEDVQRALEAAVVVTSDHFLNPNPYAAALLAGARQVQLWHGISIKEIGLRNLVGLKHMSPRMGRVMATCGPYASLVGTAAHQLDEWQRWFSFEHYAALGYARNDVLHREPSTADLLNVDHDTRERMQATRRAGRKVWFYAPTFRDGKGLAWLLEAGLDELAAAVQRQGDLLVLNVHPVEAPQVHKVAPLYPSICFVAPRTDIYPLLRDSDALITDYSSVMFDYLHLDRPVLLYRPDHEAYVSQSRQLFDAKLDDALPGVLVHRMDELVQALRRLRHDTHGAARRALRARLFDHEDGASASRLLVHIDEQLQLALDRHVPGRR